MKRIAFGLLGFALLITMSVRAQTFGLSAADAMLLSAANSTPLNSFAFQYTSHLAVDLDTFALNSDLRGTGMLDRNAAALSATLKGQVTLGTARTIPVDGEARLVNDTLYLNPGDGWQMQNGVSSNIAYIVGDITGSKVDAGKIAQWDLSGFDALTGLLSGVQTNMGSFVQAQRLADNGQTAHFQIVADLHALLASNSFVDGIVALSQAQGSDLVARSRDQIAAMLQPNAEAADPATLTIDEYFGTDDKVITRVTITLAMQITPSKAGFVDAPFSLNGSFDLTLSDQNHPQKIAAPDGAKPVMEFAFGGLPALAAPGQGMTQYLFLSTLAADATATKTFDAKAGDKVTITARRWSLDYDPNLTLLAPSGATLAQNEDHTAQGYALTDYDSQIADYAIPADGTYSVRVGDNFGDPGSVMLTITIER